MSDGFGLYNFLLLFTWCANSDGIAEWNFVAAEIQHFLRNFGNFQRVDGALVWTANDTGNIAPNFDSVFEREMCHLRESLKTFVDWAGGEKQIKYRFNSDC